MKALPAVLTTALPAIGSSSRGPLWLSLWLFLAPPLPAGDDPRARADALVSEGLEMAADRAAEAESRYRAALPLYRQAGDLRGQADCWLFLATLADQRGEAAAAAEALAESLALLRQLDDPLGVWLVLTLAAAEENLLGRHAEALRHSEEAAAILREISTAGEPIDVTTVQAYSRQTYCPDAEQWRHFASQPPLVQAAILRAFEGLNLLAAAEAQEALGQPEAALEALRQALERSRPMGLWDEDAHRSMARIHRAQGRPAEARDHLEKVLEMARKAAETEKEVEILEEIAQLERQQGRRDAALERYREILEIAQLMADGELEARAQARILELRDQAVVSRQQP